VGSARARIHQATGCGLIVVQMNREEVQGEYRSHAHCHYHRRPCGGSLGHFHSSVAKERERCDRPAVRVDQEASGRTESTSLVGRRSPSKYFGIWTTRNTGWTSGWRTHPRPKPRLRPHATMSPDRSFHAPDHRAAPRQRKPGEHREFVVEKPTPIRQDWSADPRREKVSPSHDDRRSKLLHGTLRGCHGRSIRSSD
jgi:hypothetical protein